MKVEFITSSFPASHKFLRQGCFTSSTAPHNFFSTGVSSKSWMAHSQRTSHMHPCTTGASPSPCTTAMRMAGLIPSRCGHRPRCARASMSHARARKAHGMAIHYENVWLGEKLAWSFFASCDWRSSAWSTFAVTHTRDLHELPWMRVLLVLEYEVGHVEWLTKSGKIKTKEFSGLRKN